jgi:peptidoglycan/xylan/chitin deacetylase (PgdA/CDA1 family)
MTCFFTRAIFVSLFAVAGNLMLSGQQKCTVVLTYDDALDGHLDKVIPALDSLGLPGTFYLTASSPAFTKRIAEWKKASVAGHELANHSLFHPCLGNQPGRSWVVPEYDLNNYSVRRITDELRLANSYLEAVDGKKERTYAYTCGDMLLHDTLFMNGMKDDFIAARGVHRELIQKGKTDLYNLGAYAVSENSGTEMISWVKDAQKEKATIVFLFHGVGGGHPINVSAEAHRELIRYLYEHRKDIETITFLEAAKRLGK